MSIKDKTEKLATEVYKLGLEWEKEMNPIKAKKLQHKIIEKRHEIAQLEIEMLGII